MKIFIDASAWVALENKKDIHYQDAITVLLQTETERNGENKLQPVATTPVFYSTQHKENKLKEG